MKFIESSVYTPMVSPYKIVYLALLYVTTQQSEVDLSKEYGIPRSSLQRYFTKALPQYDTKLAKLVAKKAKKLIDPREKYSWHIDYASRNKLDKSDAVTTFKGLIEKNISAMDQSGTTIAKLSKLIWG